MRSEAHNGALQPDGSGANLQDPEKILRLALALLDEAESAAGAADAIGVTGQMHGILYLDESGGAVSPLYTWLDGRLAWEESDGVTYAKRLEELLQGYRIPTGYGAATHFVNRRRGLVPAEARSLCTLPDYLVMKLAGLPAPVAEATQLQGLGVLDISEGRINEERWKRIDGGELELPEVVAATSVVGYHRKSGAVVPSVGDNQASFLGSVREPEESVHVTVGTSGQVSALSSKEAAHAPEGVEARPFPEGSLLWVGATLTAGKALALLANFVSDVETLLVGNAESDPYEVLRRAAEESSQAPPVVRTTFAGTRRDPSKRGEIREISMDNFTLGDLQKGFTNGVAQELAELWHRLRNARKGPDIRRLVGTGNALRRSPLLQKAVEEKFSLPLTLAPDREEAAYGGAVLAYAGAAEVEIREAMKALLPEE